MRLFVVVVLALAVLPSQAFAAAAAPGRPRPPLPPVAPAVRVRLVDNATAFTARLYQQLRGERGNLFVSPYSISTALAMTYAGASGETKRQMARALTFYLPDTQLHRAFADLQLALASRGQGAAGTGGQPFQLHIANALWTQPGHTFLRSYLQTIDMYYGGGLQQLDFRANPETARGAINRWVGQQTAGKIPDLLPPGVVNRDTRLVLTNAIYFNAAWQHPFPKGSTRPGPFTLVSGQKITTDMMGQTLSARYAKGPDYEVVELPYQGGMALEVVLPAPGKFAAVERALTAVRLRAIANDLRPARVAVTMPKFQFSSQFQLARALSGLGMPNAFDVRRADFSAMDGKRDLFIQAVVHKALIRLDEEGTEAAAATGVAMGVTSVPAGQPITVNVDRPFVFVIRDVQTRAILFMGRVLDPRA